MFNIIFAGKFKKGNNYYDSNDIIDDDTENTSKRKGEYFGRCSCWKQFGWLNFDSIFVKFSAIMDF